jgi:hypothetical protein
VRSSSSTARYPDSCAARLDILDGVATVRQMSFGARSDLVVHTRDAPFARRSTSEISSTRRQGFDDVDPFVAGEGSTAATVWSPIPPLFRHLTTRRELITS